MGPILGYPQCMRDGPSSGRDLPPAAESPVDPARGPADISRAARAAGIFAVVLGTIAVLYLASALLFADLAVFRDPDLPGAPDRLFLFNVALALVLAYATAASWLGVRWAAEDFEGLRPIVDLDDVEWSVWTRRVRRPAGRPLALAAGLGALCGVGMALVPASAGGDAPVHWVGHVIWAWLLNPTLFAVLGVLTQLSRSGTKIFNEMGRRVRVRLGDPAPLAPFARTGLRRALLWLLGSALAVLLLPGADSPEVVLSVIAVTVGLGLASMIGPSRGVHARIREVKEAELSWVRGEIEHAVAALRRDEPADAMLAARVPALVAWEARVAEAREWPFDAGTRARFLLLLLVPLGSWLGGALVERVVDAWLG